jgi:hypothetical protein
VTPTEYFLEELNREGERSPRACEQVPDDRYDWRPHDRSMPFEYPASMVATISHGIAIRITRDGLNPPVGSKCSMGDMRTRAGLVQGLDTSMAARDTFQKTTDDFLATLWRRLVAGTTVRELPRHVMLSDTLNRWVHRRGPDDHVSPAGIEAFALRSVADDRSFQRPWS